MFAPIWANDISEQKAAVYTANFGKEHFLLDDIKNIMMQIFRMQICHGLAFHVKIYL